MAFRPQRCAGLVFQEVPQGAVVVDAETMRAHALDATAARVFRCCEGLLDPSEMAAATEFSFPEVLRALEELQQAGLIHRAPASRISRRAALVGGAGIGASLVSSLVLPTPAMAASGSSTTTPGRSGSGTYTAPSIPTEPATVSSGQGSSPSGTASGGAVSSEEATNGRSNPGLLAYTGYNAERDVIVAGALMAAGAALVTGARPARGPAPEATGD